MNENIVFPLFKDTDEDGFSGFILALIKEEMKKRELLVNFYGQKGSSARNK